MKRIIILFFLSVFVIAGAVAQTTAEKVEAQFKQFATDLAPALPSAAVLGSTWSDAYIGQFPHLGAGAYVGAALLPLDSAKALLESVNAGATLPQEVTDLGYMPLPVLGVDARLGGLILPFDAGIKVGMIPDSYKLNANTTASYLSFGADVRYPILKGGVLLPKLSIGVGYNYLSSQIAMSGLLGGNQTLLTAAQTGTTDVVVTDPDFIMNWESSVIDLRLQASKKILFLTPYAGFGVSWAASKVGGSLTSQVTDGATQLTQAQIDAALAGAGIPAGSIDITPDGFTSLNDVNAFTYRLYLGTSVNILILKADLGASYNLVTQTFAGQVGVRVQF